jgi:hypothetical protein
MPTLSPTPVPSPVPAAVENYELFAVVGSGGCAKSLYYGTSEIGRTGAVDAEQPLFLSTSTAVGKAQHKWWLQIVTSDGGNEMFRTYWYFDGPAATLADRFTARTNQPYTVHYQVLKDDVITRFTSTWAYSSNSGINGDVKFGSNVPATCCFSNNGGAWGASSSTAVDGSSSRPSDFWGIGNFNGQDNSCGIVYQGSGTGTAYPNARVYMYAQSTYDTVVATFTLVSGS